jgi:hypothetical protein
MDAETHTMYRVETSEKFGEYDPGYPVGTGLYGTGIGIEIMSKVFKGQADDRHPLPTYDKKLKPLFREDQYLPEDFHYAFGDLEQLNRWIPRGSRHALDSFGYHVVKIEADGFVGETQAVYFKTSRKDLGSISLKDI